jgi:hypothetical protein
MDFLFRKKKKNKCERIERKLSSLTLTFRKKTDREPVKREEKLFSLCNSVLLKKKTQHTLALPLPLLLPIYKERRERERLSGKEE